MPLHKKKFVPPPPPPLPPLNKDKPKDMNKTTDTSLSSNTSDVPPSLPPLPASLTKETPIESTQNDIPRNNGDATSSTEVPCKPETTGTANGRNSTKTAESNTETTQSTGESQESDNTEMENADQAEIDTNLEGEKDDKKRPKPPTKPSRLKRAFTSSSFTLQRFNKSTKKDSRRLSMTLEDEVSVKTVETNDLRDTGLWKLPGLNLANAKGSSPLSYKEKKRSPKTSTSSMDESKFKRELPNLPKTGEVTPLPVKTTPHQSKTSIDMEAEIQKRELPPLPTEDDTEDNYSSIHPESAQQNEIPFPVLAAPSSLERSTEDSKTTLEDSSKFNDSMTHINKHDGTPPPLPSRSYVQSLNGSRRTSVVAPPKQASTLQEALDNYAGCFPLRFRVLQGYCSETSEINMSTDDVYDIHSVKETKVVTVKSDSGMTHRIPLNSPQKVGIIYNPTHDYKKGLEGHIFKSIADITSTQELPKVICATQKAKSSDGKYLVEENEIFVVRQIHRSLFKGKKGLKVISMMTMVEKLLPEDCVGYFSTNPSLARLHLPEIVEHVPKPFPVQAVMYTAGDNAATSDQPEAVTGVVTMVEYSMEASLVVSAAPFDENLELIPMEQVDFASSELFDLQLDDDMRALEVGVVQVTAKLEPEPEPEHISESESDHTYDDTLNLREAGREIDEASVSGESDHVYDDTVAVMKSEDFVIHSSNSHLNDSQQMLHSSAYSDIGRADLSGDDAFEEEEDGYDTVGLHLLKQAPSKPKSSSQHYKHSYHSDQFSGDDPMITNWLEDLQTATRSLEERMAALESEKNTTENTKMQDKLLQLMKKLESMDSQLQMISAQSLNDSKPTSAQDEIDGDAAQASDGRTPEEINKAYLSSLSMEEVCALFDAMSFSQYKEHIERELVTGDILLEFDDEVLKDELAMKSKIQRIRLMKVISGQYSAKDLLNK